MKVENLRIAFIGVGEAAFAITSGWEQARAGQITSYDIKLKDPKMRPEIEARCATLGIACEETLASALHDADLVFSTVTADQAVVAAQNAAPCLKSGAFWCDLNSCAPSSKQQAARVISGAGGRYVDVAVMAPVYPKQNLVPLLISGDWSTEITAVLERLPMAPKAVEGPVGRASSIKMVRSIMVKGLEALTAECSLAAAAAGVSEEVFPSLKSGHPKIDVEERAAYNFERSLAHGTRRAAEMEEVAKMLADLGLPNAMSRASAQWQRAIHACAGPDLPSDEQADLSHYTDKLLRGLSSNLAK